jgi:hypothetical protein
LPLLILVGFELWYAFRASSGVVPQVAMDRGATPEVSGSHEESRRQNRFGVSVIAWAIGFTGVGILVLGVIAHGQGVVVGVGAGIVLAGLYIGSLVRKM